jgi:ABC-2 type transport system permease protein
VPASVRVFLRLAVAGFRRQSHYRLAMLAGLATNVVFGFIRAAILLAAVASAGGAIGGYRAGSMSTYVWLSQGLIGAVALFGWTEISQRVRTGDIAVDLARPVDLQTAYLAADLGRAVYTFLPRGLPSVLIGAITVGLVLPGSPLPYLLGAMSILLGVAISFYCRFAINLVSFWLVEIRGVMSLYIVTASFLSGLYVPVHLFPHWLASVAAATPFPSVLQTPIDVLSGYLTGADAWKAVGLQVVWLAVCGALGRLLMAAGHRKLVVQGG